MTNYCFHPQWNQESCLMCLKKPPQAMSSLQPANIVQDCKSCVTLAKHSSPGLTPSALDSLWWQQGMKGTLVPPSHPPPEPQCSCLQQGKVPVLCSKPCLCWVLCLPLQGLMGIYLCLLSICFTDSDFFAENQANFSSTLDASRQEGSWASQEI